MIVIKSGCFTSPNNCLLLALVHMVPNDTDSHCLVRCGRADALRQQARQADNVWQGNHSSSFSVISDFYHLAGKLMTIWSILEK